MGIVTPLHDLPYLSQDMVVMDMGETYHKCGFAILCRDITSITPFMSEANITIYSEAANHTCKKIWIRRNKHA